MRGSIRLTFDPFKSIFYTLTLEPPETQAASDSALKLHLALRFASFGN